jgi:hypothetical protein
VVRQRKKKRPRKRIIVLRASTWIDDSVGVHHFVQINKPPHKVNAPSPMIGRIEED